MKFWLISLLLLINASAQEVPDLPRILFEQGKYAESIETLQKKSGKTAVDYFNLSGLYLKLNRPGNAYAYLLKTKSALMGSSSPLIQTVDENIRNAEELLNSQSQISRDVSWWQGGILPLFSSINESVFWIFFILANIIFAFSVYKSNPQRKSFAKNLLQIPLLAGLLIWTVFMTTFGIGLYAHFSEKAVVISDVATARSGPSDSFSEQFKVFSGAVLIKTGKIQNGWSQVRFSTSQIGWVLDKEILSL